MTLCYRLQLCAVLLCSVLPGLSAQPAAAQNETVLQAEDLSHRPLHDALIAFQEATGISLIYGQNVVTGKWTPLVRPNGEPPEQLLAHLLQGTGLEHYQLPSGRYGIRPKASAGTPSATGTLTGTVLDAVTEEPLPGAHVLLAETPKGTATNTAGTFTFASLPPGHYLLQVTHVGYGVTVDSVRITPARQTDLQVALRPEPIQITPLIVEDAQEAPMLSFGTLWSPDQHATAFGMGTADAIRSLNNLPGVRVGDALADVHVQGGNAGEHQFRLDGVPVFEPVHLRGLLGAFNPFALRKITVHKAGFEAQYGSHLAGVIEAEHALSSPDGRTLDLQVDPLSLNLRSHLTVGASDGLEAQFMAAGRTSLWDLFQPAYLGDLLRDWNTPDEFLSRASLLALTEHDADLGRIFEQSLEDSLTTTGPTKPDLGFYDVHLASRVRFNATHRLYASYYRGWNQLDAQRLPSGIDTTQQRLPVDDYGWVNSNGQLRYTALLNDQTLFGARVRGSRYQLDHRYNTFDNKDNLQFPLPDRTLEIRYDVVPADDGNHINEWALETTLDHAHGARSNVQLGAEVIRTSHRFIIDDIYYRPISQEASTTRFATFVEEHAAINQRLTTTVGSRFTLLSQSKSLYAEPRFMMRYDHAESPIGPWSIQAATGLYRQFVNQFDMSSVSPSAMLPSIRFWLPVDSSVTPPQAYHLTGNLLIHPTSTLKLQAEAYYKHQPHTLVIDYRALWQRLRDDGSSQVNAATDQADFLRPGEGYAYGVSVGVERKTTNARFSVRYEHSMAEREYVFADRVRYEPVPWNEPHRLELAVDWRPTSHLLATARWRSGWGRSWAYRQAYYDYLATDSTAVPTYGEIDLREPSTHTLPPLHQLDLTAAYTHEVGPVALQFRVDLLNALNRDNVADLSLEAIRNEDGNILNYTSVPRTLLPRTLLFAFRVRW